MPKKTPKPSIVVLAIGVVMFFFVILSGLMPVITQWHDDSTVQREVFINVPNPVIVAFYGVVATMLLIVAWLASLRVKNYERGQPDNRRTTKKNVHRRVTRLPQRRVDADAAARPAPRASCTRSSTSASSSCSSRR